MSTGTGRLYDCTIAANSASSDGGGVYVTGSTVHLYGCAVGSNSAGDNGGGLDILDGGSVLLDGGCTVHGDSAKFTGGGLFVTGGSRATLDESTVSGDHADNAGGLFIAQSTVNLYDCTLSGNSAGFGGALDNDFGGTASLDNCTISGNSANFGAGVGNYYGTATLTGCTISGNSSEVQRRGPGQLPRQGHAHRLHDQRQLRPLRRRPCRTRSTAPRHLINCTVSANSAVSGGGLDDSSGSVTLNNTIVAGDRAGGDVAGSYSGTDNFIGGNPLLGPLGNYGGPTHTMPSAPRQPGHRQGAGGSTPGTPPSINVASPATPRRRPTSAPSRVGPPGRQHHRRRRGTRDHSRSARRSIWPTSPPATRPSTFSPAVFGTTPRTITLVAGHARPHQGHGRHQLGDDRGPRRGCCRSAATTRARCSTSPLITVVSMSGLSSSTDGVSCGGNSAALASSAGQLPGHRRDGADHSELTPYLRRRLPSRSGTDVPRFPNTSRAPLGDTSSAASPINRPRSH